MKKEGGLVAVSKKIDECYHVRIIMRGFRIKSNEYQATATRFKDDAQLVFISQSRWLLEWKIKRWALDRAFKQYDQRQKIERFV
jgi:hypothetical protein